MDNRRKVIGLAQGAVNFEIFTAGA